MPGVTFQSGSYANVEACFVTFLQSFAGFSPAIPATSIGVQTPQDVLSRLPFIQIVRIGGTDYGWEERATIDVDVFGVSRLQAVTVAEQVRNATRSMRKVNITAPGYGARLIDWVDTLTGPAFIPYEDENVYRYVTVYGVHSRLA